MKSLDKLVEQYLIEETNELYKQQIQILVQNAATDKNAKLELKDRLEGFLHFGTAGLRAKMEAGYTRFNLVTISKAAFAVGKYLLKLPKKSKVKKLNVVIGFDARLNSAEFAEECASILTGLGIRVHMFEQMVATPVCAFSVTYLKADMGIMITASHNPAYDNGFKVYGHNGAQIISPVDREIEKWIAKAPAFDKILRLSRTSQKQKELFSFISEEVITAYFDILQSKRVHKVNNAKSVKIVYTPLHGVGNFFTSRALIEAGFTEVISVPTQVEPNGNFPTVAFPNPEEAGVLDVASELANNLKVDLVLANDPDADRLAVLVRNPITKKLVALSGNEIGVLLGADSIIYSDCLQKNKLVISTIVSSRMLSSIAKKEQVTYVETLTGFARLAHAGLALEKKANKQFIFGYEEALGYAVGNEVRDKDGISAAVRFAELYAFLLEQKQSIFTKLDELSVKYGLHSNLQWSLRLEGINAQPRMTAFMAALRKNEIKIVNLAGEAIVAKEDYLLKTIRSKLKSDVLVYNSKNNRLVVRPSGTEPKIKFYLENVLQIPFKEDIAKQRANADIILQKLQNQIADICQDL